ncbi:MAG: hypothetical protein HQL52_04845 [Magnetococcales bacterium]|nr:hypothetical protein [Magnetococcales bacterium]
MRRLVFSGVLSLGVLGAVGTIQAEKLFDPSLPLAGEIAPVESPDEDENDGLYPAWLPEELGTEETADQPPQPGDVWRLDFVRVSGTDRLAIINGQRVRLGESVDGLLVEEIDTQGVKGRVGEESIELFWKVLKNSQRMQIKK